MITALCVLLVLVMLWCMYVSVIVYRTALAHNALARQHNQLVTEVNDQYTGVVRAHNNLAVYVTLSDQLTATTGDEVVN